MPWGEPLARETMERALSLAPYFEAHFRAFQFDACADPLTQLASRALTWIRRGGLQRFTRSELHNALERNGPKGTGEKIGQAIELLKERLIIFPAPHGTGQRGRPPETYLVNLRLLEVKHGD